MSKKDKVIYSCEPCDYHTPSKFNFEKHLNTKKHLNVKTKKSDFELFECIPCKYKTTDKSNYARHFKSEKHAKNDIYTSKRKEKSVTKQELALLQASILGNENFIKRWKNKKWNDKDKQKND